MIVRRRADVYLFETVDLLKFFIFKNYTRINLGNIIGYRKVQNRQKTYRGSKW